MATAYKGRHHGEAHRGPAAGRARTTVHGLSHALRRPAASAAAILAVAGVSAAASSHAAAPAHGPTFTASSIAMAQAAQLSRVRKDTNTALAVRDGEVAAEEKAAAQAAVLVQAHGKAVTALTQGRAAAAANVSRAEVRQGLLGRAQSDPRAVAAMLAGDRGWEGAQFACLDSLWTKESGWQWNAHNGSGAYGIPQSLPGDKMASAGSDWTTNPITQITWGLQYIASSYGTPCSAWAHSEAVNWY